MKKDKIGCRLHPRLRLSEVQLSFASRGTHTVRRPEDMQSVRFSEVQRIESL